MAPAASDGEGARTREQWRPKRRFEAEPLCAATSWHKWFVALVLAGAGIASVLMSLRQAPLYEASAEVYLTRQNLSAALTGTPDPTINDDANRIAQTEAQLARAPELVRRVLRKAGNTGTSPTEFLDQSAVNPTRNSDLLEFVVRASDADMAVLLASRYASEFTQFRKELNSRNIQRALDEVNARLARLGSDGGPDAGLRNRLRDTRDELRTILAIHVSK